MEVNCPIGERHFLEIFPLREAEVIYWEGEAGGILEDRGRQRWELRERQRPLISHRELGISLSKLQEPHADTPIIRV